MSARVKKKSKMGTSQTGTEAARGAEGAPAPLLPA
jgi:hypothetical protein